MTLPTEAGEVFLGKYRVERLIGQGGMGVVIAARHLHLDRTVAVKFLLPELITQHNAVQRFIREARAAVSIESQHVARVLDVGATEDGTPYMVMEYLQGSDLSALLRKSGPLQIEDAVEYVLQACEAVVEAHRLGIVHRDLKPANLFLARQADGTSIIKVLDFGISKITRGEADQGVALTSTTAVMGSPLYMSPEQMRASASVGPQTDIWAIGVILYELLTGTVPFNGTVMTEVVSMVLTEAPRPVRDRRPDVPEGLAAVVHRCLEKEPSARFQSVAELALELARYVPAARRTSIERIIRVHKSSGYSATEPGQVPERPSVLSATESGVAATRHEGQRRATRRGAALAVVAVLSAACIIAVAATFMLRPRGSSEQAVAPDTASQPLVESAAPQPAASVSPTSLQAVDEPSDAGAATSVQTAQTPPTTAPPRKSPGSVTAAKTQTAAPPPAPARKTSVGRGHQVGMFGGQVDDEGKLGMGYCIDAGGERDCSPGFGCSHGERVWIVVQLGCHDRHGEQATFGDAERRSEAGLRVGEAPVHRR